jgi:hypothetical protein
VTKRSVVTVAILIAGFIFLRAACFGQSQPGTTQQDSLKKFLQDYLKRPFYDYKTARYFAAFVDLKDDGMQEAIVYLTDQPSCGSGGCTALILAPEGSSYRVVTSITIVRPPIRVLANKSNGWHDLAVWVQGGGIQPGYEAELPFDGRTYPKNPSTPPARPSAGIAAGAVVVPSGSRGALLYQ